MVEDQRLGAAEAAEEEEASPRFNGDLVRKGDVERMSDVRGREACCLAITQGESQGVLSERLIDCWLGGERNDGLRHETELDC